MKTVKLLCLGFALTGAALFASCTEEDTSASLSVSVTELAMDAQGLNAGEAPVTFVVTANTAWKAVAATWCTLTPATGVRGETTVIVTAKDVPTAARSGYITVLSGDKQQIIALSQSDAETVPTTLSVTPPSLTFEYGGGAGTVTITSNKKWAFTDLPAWITVSADNGAAGTIPVTLEVKKHTDATADRSVNLTVAAGIRSADIAVVQHKKAFGASATSFTATSAGVVSPANTLTVTSSSPWTATASSWIHVNPTTGSGTTTVTVTVDANPASQREGVITFTDDELATVIVTVAQDGLPPIYMEDFNWLHGPLYIWGTRYPGYPPVAGGIGEVALASWTGTFGVNHGWTKTGSTEIAWAREGYVKVGRSGRSGDMISPALSAIVGTQNVDVSFRACGFIDATRPDPYLSPNHYTAGEPLMRIDIVVTGGGTPNPSGFLITNYPDNTIFPADPNTEMAGDNWQANPVSKRTFVITGATNSTKIQFKMGPDIGTTTADGATYRFGFDDVVITVR